MDGSSRHVAKQRIYEQFARISKALASPVRLELLDLLVQGERSVDALAAATQLSSANASQHLKILMAARLVEARRKRQHVLYRLADRSVEELWQTLRRTAERRLVDLDHAARAYLVHHDKFERIDRAELLRRMKRSAVTLIDVRPADEFAQGHLPGAISVPLADVATWSERVAPRLAKSCPIVVYCRGPYCAWALEALALMQQRGVSAVWLEDGVGEWRAAGLPLGSGPS